MEIVYSWFKIKYILMNFLLIDFMGINCESNCYGYGFCDN